MCRLVCPLLFANPEDRFSRVEAQLILFLISYREPDNPLDVTTVYGKTTPVYDMGKARSVMNDTALYMVIDTVLDFLQRTR